MMKNINLIFLLSSICLAQDNLVLTRKIAIVMDTGISNKIDQNILCDGLSKDFTGYGLQDNNGHGTNIAGIVYKDTIDSCLTILKVNNSGHDINIIPNIIEAFKYALGLSPFLLNMSMEGMVLTNKNNRL